MYTVRSYPLSSLSTAPVCTQSAVGFNRPRTYPLLAWCSCILSCIDQAGEVRVQPEETAGSICQIITQIPQIFQKFPVSSPASLADDRFQFFIKEVLVCQPSCPCATIFAYMCASALLYIYRIRLSVFFYCCGSLILDKRACETRDYPRPSGHRNPVL